MDELLPDALARLSATVETLERRVYALEHPASKQQATLQSEAIHLVTYGHSPPTSLPSQSGWRFSPWSAKPCSASPGLTCCERWQNPPHFRARSIVTIALAYAAMWLVAATRVKADADLPALRTLARRS